MSIITVTSQTDSGPGSLRQAIASAKAGDTIKFASSLSNKSITLSSGQLTVNKNLTIDGAGAAGLTISGNKAHRIFDIRNDANSNPTTFTLRNLTIANGKTTGVGEDGAGAAIRTATGTKLTVEDSLFRNNSANGSGGGAIFAGFRSTNKVIDTDFIGNRTGGNDPSGKSERGGGAIAVKSESQLAVKDSEFTNNTGINGGAINTLLSKLKVEGSIFKNNDSTPGGAFGSRTKGYGGAIYTDGASGGTIEIRTSRFEGNRGAGQGGGLFLFAYSSDKVIVEDSTIIKNEVIKDTKGDSFGGGLRAGSGDLQIKNTTFAYNRALEQGGGLWVGEKTPVTITKSTFYGNRAETRDGKGGLGGGIALINGSSSTNISNTTVANNYAGFQGGGFAGGGASTKLTNTTVADNVANNGGNDWNIKHQTTKQFSDGGGNVQWSDLNANDTKVTAGVTLRDPQLGTFTDNGGAVQTLPLQNNPVVAADAIAPPSNQANNNPLNGTGNDALSADAGNDPLSNQTGDDPLIGSTGNDNLVGSDGSDSLIAVNAATNAGIGEIDILNGGAGADRFVIGDASKVFYDDGVISSSGQSDHAAIADFNKLEDQIVLHGSASSYQLGELATGTGLYYAAGQTTNELIGIVQGVSPTQLNLTESYFTYV